MDRDERDGARAARIAKPGSDARLRQAEAAVADRLALDQFAVAGAEVVFGADAPFLVLPLSMGRMRPPSDPRRKTPSTLSGLDPIRRMSRASQT